MHIAAHQRRPVHVERRIRFFRIGMVCYPVCIERQLFPGIFLQIKALLALQLVVLIQNVRKLLRQCDLLFEDRRLFDLPAKRLQIGDPLLIRSGTDHAPAAAPPERPGDKYHRRGKHADQYHLNSADPAEKFDPDTVSLTVDGEPIDGPGHIYIMLNKPAGVLTATRDPRKPTVVDAMPEEWKRRGLFPVGRLDKDTTGLLLLTDDGVFAHKVISPKSHVSKLYEAVVDGTPCEADFAAFRGGIVLRDGTQCLPAELIDLGGGRVQVEVFEGKYHQVKRMLGSRQMPVLHLKRLRIGGLWLDSSLAEGEYRRLTPEEIQKIQPDILSK